MPSVILFVGTTSHLLIYTPEANGGRWQDSGSTLATGPVRAIVAADAETLLVAVERHGAYQSFDGGATWSASPQQPPAPVGLQVMTRNGPVPLANPRLSGATAYARLHTKPPMLLGAGAGGALLFRSNDDGIHWEPAQMDGGFAGRMNSIVPDAVHGSAAWAGSDTGALLRTNDGGRSWQVVAHAPAPIISLAAVKQQ